MGFRSPIRSLPADNVTGGAFTGDYTIAGRFTVGDPAADHIDIDGPSTSIAAITAGGQRAELVTGLSTPLGTGAGVELSTGAAAEVAPGGVAALVHGIFPVTVISSPDDGAGQQAQLVLYGPPPAPGSILQSVQLLGDGSAEIDVGGGTFVVSAHDTSPGDLTPPLAVTDGTQFRLLFSRTLIQADNNGAAGILLVNPYGGEVSIGSLAATPGSVRLYDRAANPAAPTTGVRLYAKAGHLWAIGSSFAATQIV